MRVLPLREANLLLRVRALTTNVGQCDRRGLGLLDLWLDFLCLLRLVDDFFNCALTDLLGSLILGVGAVLRLKVSLTPDVLIGVQRLVFIFFVVSCGHSPGLDLLDGAISLVVLVKVLEDLLLSVLEQSILLALDRVAPMVIERDLLAHHVPLHRVHGFLTYFCALGLLDIEACDGRLTPCDKLTPAECASLWLQSLPLPTVLLLDKEDLKPTVEELDAVARGPVVNLVREIDDGQILD